MKCNEYPVCRIIGLDLCEPLEEEENNNNKSVSLSQTLPQLNVW